MTDPAAPPVHPTWPPPAPYPAAPRPPRRRWAATVATAAMCAALAAIAATVITANVVRSEEPSAPTPAPTVTVTAQPLAPSTAPPRPAAEANRATCQAWLSAGTLIRAAGDAQSVIPEGMTILDPAVQSTPAWRAGVIKAGDLYGQASETLEAGIAAGTAPVLEQTARSAVEALRALSTATTAFDEASGNGFGLVKSVANATDVLCERLAPR